MASTERERASRPQKGGKAGGDTVNIRTGSAAKRRGLEG